VQWPFTTLVLGPGEVATTLETGDVLVELPRADLAPPGR